MSWIICGRSGRRMSGMRCGRHRRSLCISRGVKDLVGHTHTVEYFEFFSARTRTFFFCLADLLEGLQRNFKVHFCDRLPPRFLGA